MATVHRRRLGRLLLGAICAAAAAVVAETAECRAAGNAMTPADVVSTEPVSGLSAPDKGPSRLSFDVRAELGEAMEQSDEFKTYHSGMNRRVGDQFADIMRSCFASVENPQTARFVLVADITAEGRADAVEVRPPTNIARCFAAGLKRTSFPIPPPFPDREGFPITIKMRIQ